MSQSVALQDDPIDPMLVAAVAAPFLGRGQSVIEGIRQGHLEVRLARDVTDIHLAQRLRYQVFALEMGARLPTEAIAQSRDFDRFDDYCDHLLVIDHSGDSAPGERGAVVGTYRLLRKTAAEAHGGFYTATEFDIAPLIAFPGEIMEVGRACVHPSFRGRPTMQLLWRGIASYSVHYNVRIMFGCASLPGTDLRALARPLSYLHRHHLAPDHLRASALPHRQQPIEWVAQAEGDAEAVVAAFDPRATLAALPPLIKGYLRLGGMIGEGAVIDPDFGTTDVCIIVVTDQLAEKYFNHYLRNGG